ncbi:MAG: hypothetical protein KA885_14335 [Spirochaetes bacterium]|nr:hypothetical protein [Spirochaetota bacterium]
MNYLTEIIDKILSRDEFLKEPPVLVDIGASGTIHKEWKDIAKYSICIAFDADDREMGYIEKLDSGFKKLIVYNCIVSDKNESEMDFYLTKSPYCSSLLEPDAESLQNYSFAELFQVDKKVRLKSRSLYDIINELGLKNIDWFKTDSQGTDLRLFKTIPDDIKKRVLIAEFEPGIIDAYKGEDKYTDVLIYMKDYPFWITDMIVKGPERINNKIIFNDIKNGSQERYRYGDSILKSIPGWMEISFFNNFKDFSAFTLREFLLAWVLSIIKEQVAFAYEIAVLGRKKFNDEIFSELVEVNNRLFQDKIKILDRKKKKERSIFRRLKNKIFKNKF